MLEVLQQRGGASSHADGQRSVIALGSFARGNPLGFHRRDGAGYALLAGLLPALDAANPQVAARLLGSFESWRRWQAPRGAQAQAVLQGLAGQLVSPDCRDLLQRLLD